MLITREVIAEHLNIFGYNLRRYRNKLGLSYDKMALKSGISKSIISRIENGQTAPSFDTLLRLYLSFDVTTQFFKSDSDPDNHTDLAPDLNGSRIFKRVNFLGRTSLSAELEEILPGSAIRLKARRSFEENIVVVYGEIILSYQIGDGVILYAGDLYTIPTNRHAYEIESARGAKFIRILTPFSRDLSGKRRYRSIFSKNKIKTAEKLEI